MKLLTLILAVFLIQDSVVPYKPKEEFDVKLDFAFKQRPTDEHTAIHFDETQAEHDKRVGGSVLPYVTIKVNVLKLQTTEVRLRVTDNLKGSNNKKVSQGAVIPIVLGFTDDVKDRVTPHDYTITFLTSDRKDISRISIFVEEDGTFLVNGEKRGKL